ncbi:MAG TPA: hypothetical protein VI916_13360 [Acidimicrobiia bacterium]|nr:hypothetical protein [Acidimicrobiia bacterium]
MTISTPCPHCGAPVPLDDDDTLDRLAAVLEARERGTAIETVVGIDPAAAAAVTDSWEVLRPLTPPPLALSSFTPSANRTSGPQWWLPSLAYLAYQSTDRPDARGALDAFALRRDRLGYAVVEERTDDTIGLSIEPWPLVDRQGRLRFPIHRDPHQLEIDVADLAGMLSAHRQRWRELGLLPEGLGDRGVEIGDAYGVSLTGTPAAGGPPQPEVFPELPMPLGQPALPGGELVEIVIDVTWDAREAGKLAHYAAVAGVVPTDPDARGTGVAAETEERYLIGFDQGIDPRDLLPSGQPARDIGPEQLA